MSCTSQCRIFLSICLMSFWDASTATYPWYTWHTAWNWLLSLMVISAKVCKWILRWRRWEFDISMHLEVAFFNCLQNLLSSRRNAVFSSVLRDKTMTESQALLSSFHPNWHYCLDLTLSNSLVLTLSRIPTLLGVLFLLSLACTIKHDQMTSSFRLRSFPVSSKIFCSS